MQFALSRPPCSLSDPIARFLPHYSKTTFAFVPLDTGGGEDEDEEMEAPSDSDPHSDADSAMGADDSETSRSSSCGYPAGYGDTLEGWLEMNEERYRRSRYADNRSLRSYIFREDEASGGGQAGDVEHAPETELLARHGSGKLCTLVVAPRDRLPQAMSSALYHRRACGVVGPVAGLVINHGSTAVEFAVGWLGGTPEPEGELVRHLSRFCDDVR